MRQNGKAAPLALVTGASSGMGKDFAHALLDEGYRVIAAAIDAEPMSDLAEKGAIIRAFDLSRENEVHANANEILATFGGVDLLINNAGYGLWGAVEDVPLEAGRHQFEVNFFSHAILTQKFLPSMRERGSGRIIFMSSMAAKTHLQLGSWYHATKHAIEGYSDCLRLELEPFGIKVIIIEPGAIFTGFGFPVERSLVQYSVGGHYNQRAVSTLHSLYAFGEDPRYTSPPSEITKLVMKAVRSKRPKRRYVGGKFAMPMMALRKWLGYGAYEFVHDKLSRKFEKHEMPEGAARPWNEALQNEAAQGKKPDRSSA